jgi:hypothetical protein
VTSAALVTWTGGAGDIFNDSSKWTPSGPPGTADVAVFNNDTNGNVNFNANINPQGLLFQNASGAITMDLAGKTLSMGSTATTGTIILSGGVGKVSDVTFTGGTLQHTHASGAMLTIGAANSHGNKVTFTGSSMLSTGLSSGSSFATVGVASSNNNELNVTNGASVIWRGTMNVGVVSTSSGNVVNVNNATFSSQGGSRGINLRNGSLIFTKTYSDFGFLDVDDAGNTTTLTFNSGTLFSRRTQIDNGKNFVIGDGGAVPATYLLAHSGGLLTLAANSDLVINSNGVLSGHGSGTLAAGTGKIRGIAGAKVSPYNAVVVADLGDDRKYGTLTFATPSWDNSNIQIALDVGDFPAAVAAVPSYTPLDFVNVIGAFTHGGKVSFDMSSFVGPTGLDTEYKVVSWTTEVGSSALTNVEFLNGTSLPYRFAADGLYLMVPEPASLSTIALLGLFCGRRRNREV